MSPGLSPKFVKIPAYGIVAVLVLSLTAIVNVTVSPTSALTLTGVDVDAISASPS